MRNANRLSKFIVSLALIMALIAFALGSAPFTPALILAIIALPMAIGCAFFGVLRLSIITVYWAIAAFLAVPMAGSFPIGVDVSLVILGIVGLSLSAFLYTNYERAKLVN